jgi:hypothetical protein
MKSVTNTGMTGPSSRSGVKVVARRRTIARYSTHLVWRGLLRLVQRLTHYKRGDGLEFRIGYSVRDVVGEKSRAVKDQMEALAAAVQKAGSYQARDEAMRAVHAVIEALNDRVPPDVLMKLSESLPVREAARLRRAASERLHKK